MKYSFYQQGHRCPHASWCPKSQSTDLLSFFTVPHFFCSCIKSNMLLHMTLKKSHTAKEISTDCLHLIKFSPEYSACCPALLSYCQLSDRLSLPSHGLTLFPLYFSYQNCWDDYLSMIRNIFKTCPLCKRCYITQLYLINIAEMTSFSSVTTPKERDRLKTSIVSCSINYPILNSFHMSGIVLGTSYIFTTSFTHR